MIELQSKIDRETKPKEEITLTQTLLSKKIIQDFLDGKEIL